MKHLFSIASILLLIIPFGAQSQSLSLEEDMADFLVSPEAQSQTYYQQLLSKKGANYRYEAAAISLNKYANSNEEYCSKLYNLLAEEAVLLQDYAQAKCYYNQTIATQFEEDYYTQGLLAEQEKIKATIGLRNIALAEQKYQIAIDYHQKYLLLLEDGWSDLIAQNKLRDDKILATCYQKLNKSEKAIALLAPYAFGNATTGFSQIDKPAIEHLTDLLKTKYPKRVFKKMKLNLPNQIYSEIANGKMQFYIQILDNKIFFKNDGANYASRVLENDTLLGQAIAHYQRKLMNSYFYQSIMQR